jgi:hypothetical protein
MLAELERRGGATPLLAEWSEFRDAFRSRVGVPERDGVPIAVEPLRGLRIELPGRGVLGDLIVCLREPEARGRGERGDLAGEDVDVEIDSWFRDWAKSPSSAARTPLLSARAIVAETLFGGDADLENGDAILCAGRSARQLFIGWC